MRTNKFRRVFTSVDHRTGVAGLCAAGGLCADGQHGRHHRGGQRPVGRGRRRRDSQGHKHSHRRFAHDDDERRRRLRVDDASAGRLPHRDRGVRASPNTFRSPSRSTCSARVTIDAEMRPAGATEQVTVTGESVPLIETTKTEVSGVIDQRQMENLPVNGRSFASLATLIPGATLQPSFDPTKARVGTFSVGGSTGRNLNITVDGGDNKDNAVGGILQNFTMEGIQEFALSTQRFSRRQRAVGRRAAFGRQQERHKRYTRQRVRLLPRRVAQRQRREAASGSQPLHVR